MSGQVKVTRVEQRAVEAAFPPRIDLIQSGKTIFALKKSGLPGIRNQETFHLAALRITGRLMFELLDIRIGIQFTVQANKVVQVETCL